MHKKLWKNIQHNFLSEKKKAYFNYAILKTQNINPQILGSSRITVKDSVRTAQ